MPQRGTQRPFAGTFAFAGALTFTFAVTGKLLYGGFP